MIKLGCVLRSMAKTRWQKTTDSNFYPFTETDKDLLEKRREDMVRGSFTVFTCKALVDESLIRKSMNLCKSIVGVSASQF